PPRAAPGGPTPPSPHPPGGRAVGHQEGEDLLGGLDEKFTLLILRRLEEGHRQSLRLGASAEFFRGPPVGTPLIERIQDNVDVFRVVKPLDELSCGVVDDRGIATMFYLPKNLEHDHSLARSGISDDHAPNSSADK